MNNIISDKEKFIVKTTSDTNFETYQSSGYINSDSSFLFAVSKKNNVELIQGNLTPYADSLFSIFKDNFHKEKFYITAIKNLIKQKNYINLIYELTNELIDEEEFSEELTKNEDKYLIKIDNNLDNLDKIQSLINVLQNIDEDLAEEDLIELFSVKDSNVLKKLTINHKK
jgi:hypothetical protein